MKSLSTALAILCLIGLVVTSSIMAAEKPLTMVVMDPLAAPLSCPCVEGYAQRKYELLGNYLTKRIGRPVQVVFSESLVLAKSENKLQTIDIVIGKDSVVRFDADVIQQPVRAFARLTGKDGLTTQYGMILVRHDDSAQKISDLNGYRIFFGPAAADEKHKAALELFKKNGVSISEKLEISEACSDGACQVVDLGAGKAAAVISSYAAPLLEGCGTIKKGDLRVIAQTESVPFVTAFVSESLNGELSEIIEQAILEAGQTPEILIALESLMGFVKIEQTEQVKKN
ncbi:PhnD/SsuA/transferrin family substrate-binding protein [Rubinisphaera sp.]|uniref:PhnD/SsuA/transferrin family substrate-binding protein n=1 Tax=Rubinisphaera sp. TaxID=2024857 RepID=UPI000C1095B5|nr:PhnD/SsuA/transferrin family substrate-binding protein [Rubinisphaera sp.]MBV10034.1 hypothetical protein [Rubinisphaera sp.]HCS52719.1 hypothetical protein [Planctomycetaceae bacterium]|tara:strand:- start:24 stop:878 length:855 start_codon:yes stop_codon:yes gene_type:complete